MFITPTAAPCEEIHTTLLKEKGIRLWLKREDLLHPKISGNKWRKLRYNILKAKAEEKDTILTFGGAFSNHIYATAAAANENGFNSIGIIRGEAHVLLNSTLRFAECQGMKLVYMDRETYRKKSSAEIIANLREKYGSFYLVPEGGTNLLALKGCAEIIKEIEFEYDYICCSVGTGGTMAGLITGLNHPQKSVLGFSALKGDFHETEVQSLISFCGTPYSCEWKMLQKYHFGGYAKISPELIKFIEDFEERHHILLDPIYTGKMMFGIFDLISEGYFLPGSKIVALHTGGIQGWSGIIERFKNKSGYDFAFTNSYLQ